MLSFVHLQAFGVPTIIVHLDKPVMLFGSDRFPILAQLLGMSWYPTCTYTQTHLLIEMIFHSKLSRVQNCLLSI